MRLTFRSKLFLYFVLIILFTAIPIGLITYNYMYNSLKSDLYSNTKVQMIQIDNNISNMFKQIKEDTSFLATSDDIKKSDQSISALFNIKEIELHNKYSKEIPGIESTIYNQLETYAKTHPQTTYVSIGTKWGGYIQWPDGLSAGKFDPRERPWYTNALANPDQVVISEPFMPTIDNSNNAIISASTTIRDTADNILGVMCIDISLENLSEIIKDINIGDTGYIFLFLKDGTMLAHSNSSLNFKNVLQMGKPDASSKISDDSKYCFENANKLIGAENGSFETVINGDSVIVNVYTSPDTGWKMASVIQKSELIYKAEKIGYLIISVTLFVLLFAIILTLVVTKMIAKPITELTPLMFAAGNGDLTVKADINTKGEFGQLGKSFNLMICKLSDNYEELSAVYEELIATEEELRAQYQELQENEEALRNSDERYRIALEGANDSIWQWDLVTGIFFASDKLYDVTGYKVDENTNFGELILDIIHPDDLEEVKIDFRNHIKNITSIYKSEYRIRINDGSYVWVSARGKALKDSNNKAIKLAGSITDISERKISEEKIEFMAFHDSLTKLPNRTFFMDKLNYQLSLVKSENKKGAVFFIDLDNFKNINDTMGHDYGDKLLIYLSKQFKKLINEKDTICRLGGDEFMLIHPYYDEAELEYYTKEILDLFNKVFKIDNKQMYITASIGVALYPKDGTDTSTILKNADSAMYKAKELGKNRFSLFDPEMYLKLERKIAIERILRNAIENNELSINYQPQYDSKNNTIFGFEALLRLNSKELGFISPFEFIPIAEESGYITKLGQWVLNEACRQSVKWLNEGYKFKSMSINISSVDLQQPDFLENIRYIIKNTSINPNIVELEITETVLMQSLDSSIKTLKELMDMGIRIALDDFGTGYSSLSYLRKIPISTLKIDKSFIDNITFDEKDESIIKNIIPMAHSLNLKVVAEGVETKEQLSILKEINCDYIQGYYFSKPLPANEIERLLSD